MGGSVPNMPGQMAEGDLLRDLQKQVAQLLGRSSPKFPGAQPVSFSARHLKELQQQDYFLCEKSDGIRCLLWLTHTADAKECIYLIDRNNDYYYIEGLHFAVSMEHPAEFHTQTIIDGELVKDSRPDGNFDVNFLVFDCLVLDGDMLMQRPLDKRLAYYSEKIDKPFRKLYQHFPQELQYRPFNVIMKEMQFAYGTEMMFRDILPKLTHGNDGLVFTCRNTPYQFGTDPHIIKWKPPNENSIDFVLNLEWPLAALDSEDEEDGYTKPYRPDYYAKPTFRLDINHGNGQERPFGTMYLDDAEWEAMKAMKVPLDHQIVECYLEPGQRWRFIRFRHDKKEANHISTANSVMESITDRITTDRLIKASKPIRDAWKLREAQRRPAAQHATATA